MNLSKPSIQVFPNPAHSHVSVQVPSKAETIQLINMNGQVVYASDEPIEDAVQIPILSLPNGVYIIKVYLKELDIQVQKLIVRH